MLTSVGVSDPEQGSQVRLALALSKGDILAGPCHHLWKRLLIILMYHDSEMEQSTLRPNANLPLKAFAN